MADGERGDGIMPLPVQDAAAALARSDWPAAHAALDVAPLLDPADEAARLDLLGEACWWLGRMDDCITAREQAYRMFDALGLSRRAGQVAVWLFEHHHFKGRPAIASAWLRRARRALEDDSECVEWGNVILREAEEAHGAGELRHGLDNATVALELGRRLRSADLEAEALQTLGRILVDDSRPREGMAHLDEAMLLAVEGRLGQYATGKVYCSLVSACEEVGDLRRAAEWTDATVRWSQQHPFAVFPGLCRIKRAEVLQWRGEWEEAEREARRACEELANVKVGSAAAAWGEIGDIRRRLGDLDGAETAFERAAALDGAPVAGLALLRLAQGRVDAATSLVAAALDDPNARALARARVLPAAVQVAIAAGDLDGAGRAADDLEEIAAAYGTAALQATACTATGRVRLARGDTREACAALRRAVEQWQDLDVPYEAATAQLLLGHACHETGDADQERAAVSAAVETFERLGAAYEARGTGAAARREPLPGGLTEREAEVLRLVAEGHTNKEIAARLVLSEKTIARHLSNIFVKIGAATRTAAAAFAFERGIAPGRGVTERPA